MANVPPIFDADEITAIASSGGYSNLVPMSDLTNLIILSALPFISNRNFWQTTLNPITDSQWDDIQQYIDTATGELMTNIAIGSIFYSVALLTDPNVKIPIGQTLLQADYPELTAVVPASWLVGLNIQLPDLRDTFMIGTPTGGQNGLPVGANTVTLVTAEIPSHTHTQLPHTHIYNNPVTLPALGGAVPATASIVVPTPLITATATATNLNTGGDAPHNNKPLSLQAYAYLVVK